MILSTVGARVQVGSASGGEPAAASDMDDGRSTDPPERPTRHPLRQRHRRAADQQRPAAGRRRVPAASEQRARRGLVQDRAQHTT